MKTLIFLLSLQGFVLFGQSTVTVSGKSEMGGAVMLYKNRKQVEYMEVSKSGKFRFNGLTEGNTYNVHFLPENQDTHVQKTVFIDLLEGEIAEDQVVHLQVNLEPISDFSSVDVFFEPISKLKLDANGYIEYDMVYLKQQKAKIESFKINAK